MALNAELLHRLTTNSSPEAWDLILEHVVSIACQPLSAQSALREVTNRDQAIGLFDNFLTTSGWDLWQTFGDDVERTSDRLIKWWAQPHNSKAILILDGLSLREMPWLIQGAQQRGFTIHTQAATGSEIPGDTNSFAQALGFSSRSQLQNNLGGGSHKLPPATTECVDIPWRDCCDLVDASPNWIFWHHWPDVKVHDGSGAGQGLDALTKNVVDQLSQDDFWEFVERLAHGRRLVITSDHGYAATGLFFDATEEQAVFLKNAFKSGRNTSDSLDCGPFIPPVAVQITSNHGSYLLANGRWKWRSPGGYPTLAHGGLSMLEVLSPFVEMSK